SGGASRVRSNWTGPWEAPEGVDLPRVRTNRWCHHKEWPHGRNETMMTQARTLVGLGLLAATLLALSGCRSVGTTATNAQGGGRGDITIEEVTMTATGDAVDPGQR